jgi:hypothetical protein
MGIPSCLFVYWLPDRDVAWNIYRDSKAIAAGMEVTRPSF